jgi:hypothetical protein
MTIRVTLRVLHSPFDRCSHLTTFFLYHFTILRLFMHCSVSPLPLQSGIPLAKRRLS